MNCNGLNEPQKKICKILQVPTTRKTNSPYGFTNNKDTDLLILSDMSDEDLINVCSVNSYLHNICNTESFWMNRLSNRFGNSVVQGKPEDITWKDYYLFLSGGSTPIMLKDRNLIANLNLGTINPIVPNSVTPLTTLLLGALVSVTTFKQLLSIIHLYQKINGKNPTTDIVVHKLLDNIRDQNTLTSDEINLLNDIFTVARLNQEQALIDDLIRFYN